MVTEASVLHRSASYGQNWPAMIEERDAWVLRKSRAYRLEPIGRPMTARTLRTHQRASKSSAKVWRGAAIGPAGNGFKGGLFRLWAVNDRTVVR